MFTGLVEEVGRIQRRTPQGAFQDLNIAASLVTQALQLGDSVNINGACQTVVEMEPGWFRVQSVAETLQRTTLGRLQAGDAVNLERSLRPQDRMGGHLVLGHVDGIGRIRRIEQGNRQWTLDIEVPAELEHYIATKGSIAVEGVSLTVTQVRPGGFAVSVIPHTFEHTTLSLRQGEDEVNLEIDIIARYVERLLQSPESGGKGMSLDDLRSMGY
ncbi:MAG: riboflavin synthase [Candidatus Latescibacteria bacterium]|nr:riboflavin synthase [Candidatus Latescibacterota bacterium]